MALEDYRADAMRCNRCSYCKWIPQDRIKSWEFAKGCPSIDYRHFHAYSGVGRLVALLSLTDGRSEITDELVDVVYECTLCGQCDVSCKVCRYDMHPLSGAKEFRHYLNQRGVVPPAYPGIIAKLRESGNMAGAPRPNGLNGRKDWVSRHSAPPASTRRTFCSTPAVSIRSTPPFAAPFRRPPGCFPRAAWISPSMGMRAAVGARHTIWATATTSRPRLQPTSRSGPPRASRP